jgi:cyclic pyranopterin phosphate synthase
VVSREQVLAAVTAEHGAVEPLLERSRGNAPAERFRLNDGTVFGIIASVTAPFCRDCDRSRITADGTWYQCLYADRGVDLRDPLRLGAGDAAIAGLVREEWSRRTDRGAEARLALPDRAALYGIQGLKADPRREMHTRGG